MRQALQEEKMSVLKSGASVLVLLFACCACRDDPQAGQPMPSDRTEVAAESRSGIVSRIVDYEAIEVTEGGTIRGTIRIMGEAPEAVQIPVQKDTEVCGLSVVGPSITLGPANTVVDAVVYLRGVTKGRPLVPAGRAVEQQIVKCALTPRLEFLPLGSTLELRNGDPIVHEIQAFIGDTKIFEVFLPFKDFRARVELDQFGIVALRCSAGHTWMSGTLVVQEHPYYSRTDSRGAYSIEDIPSGPHRLALWHELLGEMEVDVTVETGAVTTMDLELEAPR
jgi:hypothetical protein